jgi:predicted metal-binding membrane protein
MLMMVALGATSLMWMTVIALIVLTQKLLAPKAVVDVPIALIIVALGAVILAVPSWVPGLVHTMQPTTSM